MFVLLVSSGELMRPSEHLILAEFQFFLQSLGLTTFQLNVKHSAIHNTLSVFFGRGTEGCWAHFREIFLKRLSHAY